MRKFISIMLLALLTFTVEQVQSSPPIDVGQSHELILVQVFPNLQTPVLQQTNVLTPIPVIQSQFIVEMKEASPLLMPITVLMDGYKEQLLSLCIPMSKSYQIQTFNLNFPES